jgi:hypothetical protein
MKLPSDVTEAYSHLLLLLASNPITVHCARTRTHTCSHQGRGLAPHRSSEYPSFLPSLPALPPQTVQGLLLAFQYTCQDSGVWKPPSSVSRCVAAYQVTFKCLFCVQWQTLYNYP